MSEEWREIKGYPNYFISNLGRVKNKKHGDRILKLSLKYPEGTANNHYRVKLWNGGYRLNFLIHRLVAEHFCERTNESYKFVKHVDGNTLNNNANNLVWSTLTKLRPLNIRHCELCNFTSHGNCSFNKHLKSQKHLKREYQKETYDCVEGETILFMN